METQPSQQPQAAQPQLSITTSRLFTAWMLEQGVSLGFSTYEAGKVFLIGLQPDGRLSVFERTLERCMGFCATDRTLYLSTLYQLWRFENALEPGQEHNGYDRLYIPRMSWVTGDIDIHDMALDGSGRLCFISTLFSCLATVSEQHSFAPLWKPPFISRLAAEDRCHLNGLALRDGRPRYVTCVSASDVNDGWREKRRDGGMLIDIHTDETLLGGLSMPHSPRWYRERLWLLDSGSGYFGYADLAAKRFVPLTFCPGYLRGLSFVGDFAVVGTSGLRQNRTFAGLSIEENLRAKNAEARCGLQVIDLRTGDVVQWVRIEGVINELYDVVLLPGVRRPMILGFKTDEVRRTISVGPWMAPGNTKPLGS